MEMVAAAGRRHLDLSTVAKDARLSLQISKGGGLNLHSSAKWNQQGVCVGCISQTRS